MIALIVHGGAKEIPAEQHDAHREGCRRAAEAGYAVLQKGGSAVDAVETAIRALEDDPTFNAGYGAELNADGEVQTDAGLMVGDSLKAGAVAFVQRVRNPIGLARKVLECGEVLLVGDGAERFAVEQGIELCANESLITAERRKEWEEKSVAKDNDTVGCVALDGAGHLAAGASTGGTGGNRRGRVGDSPQLGCGFYADDERGGCSMTGDGEQIAKVVLAKSTVDRLERAEPEEAIQESLRILERRTKGEAGCIAIRRDGPIGWGHNSVHMAVAYRTEAMPEATAYVSKEEEWQRKNRNGESPAHS